jgi:hypothetical protein
MNTIEKIYGIYRREITVGPNVTLVEHSRHEMKLIEVKGKWMEG